MVERWERRDREKEDKYANLLCDECGEVLFYSKVAKHSGGPFFKREVSCPNCGRTGIKLIRMWELETLRGRDVVLEGK